MASIRHVSGDMRPPTPIRYNRDFSTTGATALQTAIDQQHAVPFSSSSKTAPATIGGSTLSPRDHDGISGSSPPVKAGPFLGLLKSVVRRCSADYGANHISHYLRFLNSANSKATEHYLWNLTLRISALRLVLERLRGIESTLCSRILPQDGNLPHSSRPAYGDGAGSASHNSRATRKNSSGSRKPGGHGRKAFSQGTPRNSGNGSPYGDPSSSHRKPRSNRKTRIPCICHVAQPDVHDHDLVRYDYMCQLERHLMSHDIYICRKCLSNFASRDKAEARLNKQRHRCFKRCSNNACRRTRREVEGQRPENGDCQTCIESWTQQWEAMYHIQYPGRPIPPHALEKNQILSPLPRIPHLNPALGLPQHQDTADGDRPSRQPVSHANMDMLFPGRPSPGVELNSSFGTRESGTLAQHDWTSERAPDSELMDEVQAFGGSELIDLGVEPLHDYQMTAVEQINTPIPPGLPTVSFTDNATFTSFGPSIEEMNYNQRQRVAEDLVAFRNEPVFRSTAASLTQDVQIQRVTGEVHALRGQIQELGEQIIHIYGVLRQLVGDSQRNS